MEFERATRTVRAAEQLLTRAKPPKEGDGVVAVFFDTLLVGPWLVMAGTKILSRRLGLMLLIALTLLIYLWVMDQHIAWQPVLPAFILAMGSVYFGLPSRTVVAGVTSQNIGRLAQIIRESVSTASGLERLHAGVTILRIQTFERLARFNVIAGVGWAALFWYASSHVLAPGLEPRIWSDGIVHTLVAAFIFFTVLAFASSYAVAVRAVYLTFDFALLEAKAESTNKTGDTSAHTDVIDQ